MAPGSADSDPDNVGRKWAPRFWLGASSNVFLRLMWRHRFAVHGRQAPVALADGLFSFVNSALGIVESVLLGGRVDRHPLPIDPIFVVGHWRTGTSLMHELLACDPRLAAPTAYQCLAPHHFLVTGRVFPKLLAALLPHTRVIDNMSIRFDSPFEDEFALALLGARSPYETLAFANHQTMTPEMLDPADFSEPEREKWLAEFRRFVKRVSFVNPGHRMVLKSPPHTCRIRMLLEVFPDARFVMMHRNPYDVFPSAVHTWNELRRRHGFQTPHNRDLREMTLSLFSHSYACWHRDKSLIPRDRYCEIRYEQLVKDPAAALNELYDNLSLGSFEVARRSVEDYLSQRANYRTNRLQPTGDERKLIEARWGSIIRELEYG